MKRFTPILVKRFRKVPRTWAFGQMICRFTFLTPIQISLPSKNGNVVDCASEWTGACLDGP